MKHLLSWIVLVLLTFLAKLSLVLVYIFSNFFFDTINSGEKGILYSVLYFGYIIFLIWLFGIVYLDKLGSYIPSCSQSIYPSRTGARYIIVAIINTLQTGYNYYNNPEIYNRLGIIAPAIIAFLLPLWVAKRGKSMANEFKEQEFKEKVEEYVRNMEE